MRRQKIVNSWVRGERGVVLILSYLVVAVFLALQASYLNRVAADNQFVQRYEYRARALHLGDAGADEAISHLHYLASYTGTPTTLLGSGSFASTVMPTGHVDNSDIFPKTELRIQSSGQYPTDVNIGPETRQVTDIVAQQPRPFTYALFAATPISVNGTLIGLCVDSRSLDAPCPQSRIGTNATGPNSIRVVGTLDTNGAVVTCGANCNPANDITVVGFEDITRAALQEAKTFPVVNVPTALSNEGSLDVPATQTRILTPGMHLFSGLRLGANSTLTASGPVIIFIDFRSSPGLPQFGPNAKILAPNDIPTNFVMHILLSKGLSTTVPVSNATVKAAIYVLSGDGLTFQFTNGAITGSFISSAAVQILGSTTFTYDLALANVPVGFTGIPWEFDVSQKGWVIDR